MYWASLRADTKLARTFVLGEGSWLKRLRHQVEPSVIYEYVGQHQESLPPFFDELESLDSQHRVTYSIQQRFVAFYGEGDRSLRFLTLKLTQSYNIKRPPVPALRGDPVQRPISDLRGEMVIATPWPVTLEVESFMDVYSGALDSVNSDLNIRLTGRWRLALGQRFTRSDHLPQRGDLFNPLALNQRVSVPRINFLSLSTSFALPMGFILANRTYYDVERQSRTEIDYGISYQSQCWSAAFAYQDLPEKRQFSFMITLKGAGTVESGLLHRLFAAP